MRISHHIDFLLAVLIIIVIISFSFATYMRWVGMSFFMGPLRFSHWLTIIGTSYIAIATPAFIILKRSYPQKMKELFRFHIFGNLVFFVLISIHFANQMGRPATNFPDFCFWGMRKALNDAIRIRFQMDGKEELLYNEQCEPHSLPKWIDLAKQKKYVSSHEASYLKSVKAFGDGASHDYMADLQKEEGTASFCIPKNGSFSYVL